MRIAFFTDTYEPQINGVVTAINLFKRELEKNSHEVYIVCPKVDKYDYKERVFTVKSFKFRPYPEYRAATPSIKLIQWIKKLDPDIIHIHSPVIIGLMGIFLGKLFSKPIVMTYHTLIDEYFKIYFIPKGMRNDYTSLLSQKFVKNYTKFFYNEADLVIAPSSAIKKILLDYGIKKEIVILPTGIDLDNFKINKKYKKERIVLWVGRLGKEKNLEVLFKAFKIVQEKIKDVKLIVVGDGPERKNLEKLARKLKLNVEFTGYVKREELIKYYSKASVLVSPSTTETQGLTILEAFACSCPAVVSNSLGFKDFVIHGKNGFFAGPDPEDFAEKIIKLLEDEELRKKLSDYAFKTAKEFSIENQTKKLLKIYERVIQNCK